MGVSAKFIDALNKAGFKNKYKLKNLRTICSTGSPLSKESFEYIYKNIKKCSSILYFWWNRYCFMFCIRKSL